LLPQEQILVDDPVVTILEALKIRLIQRVPTEITLPDQNRQRRFQLQMLLQRQEIVVQALNTVHPQFIGEAAFPFVKYRRRIERLHRRSWGKAAPVQHNEKIASIEILSTLKVYYLRAGR
jgi:ribosomal protein L31